MSNNNLDLDQKIKFNIRKIYKGQLAIEDYLDTNNVKDSPEKVKLVFQKISEYREIKPTLNKEELLMLTDDVCKALEDAYNEIGRDNFIFYDDGDVNYDG